MGRDDRAGTGRRDAGHVPFEVPQMRHGADCGPIV